MNARAFSMLSRGLAAVEGLVNRTRGELGLAALLDDQARLSMMLDRVAGHLIAARDELTRFVEVERTLGRVRRGSR